VTTALPIPTVSQTALALLALLAGALGVAGLARRRR
jgi:hypothetical protein